MPVVTRAYTTACVITTLAVVGSRFAVCRHEILISCRCVHIKKCVSYSNVHSMFFQQLDLVSPFQLYFNPILIVKQYQVRCLTF